MPDSPDQIMHRLEQENRSLKNILKQKDKKLERKTKSWNRKTKSWNRKTKSWNRKTKP